MDFDFLDQNLDIIQTCFNQIHPDDVRSVYKFGSKKSIKRWFESDFSQNFTLGQFNRLSLRGAPSGTFCIFASGAKQKVFHSTALPRTIWGTS